MKLQTYTRHVTWEDCYSIVEESNIVDINLSHITSITPVVYENYVLEEIPIQKKPFFGNVTTYYIRDYVHSDDVHLFKWTMKNRVDFLVKEDYDLETKCFRGE